MGKAGSERLVKGSKCIVPVLGGWTQTLDARVNPDHFLGSRVSSIIGIVAALHFAAGDQEGG